VSHLSRRSLLGSAAGVDGAPYDNLSGQQAYQCFACRVIKADA
jgi:hypothetical protein